MFQPAIFMAQYFRRSVKRLGAFHALDEEIAFIEKMIKPME